MKPEFKKIINEEQVLIQLKLTLEDGTVLYVREEGYAEGSDGRRYYCVARDVKGELEVLGWSAELMGEQILPEISCCD